MNLINVETGVDVLLEENIAHVVCIEEPKSLLLLAGDLWTQTHGGSGSWILSEREKEYSISKEVECIYNPFSLNCNETKILSKVYREIQIEANDTMHEEILSLNAEIIDFLSKLTQREKYNLEYELDLDLVALLKAYQVKLESCSDNFVGQIIEYASIIKGTTGKRIFIFLNIKNLLTEKELEEVYKGLFYEKIYPILIEGVDQPKRKDEIKHILDPDSCLIEVK